MINFFFRDFLSKLRFPSLLKFTLFLLLLTMLIPDPIPFLDELLLATFSILFASWKKPQPKTPRRTPIPAPQKRLKP